MRRFVLIVAAVLVALTARAQEPDLEALHAAIYATDVETVLRYLPPEMEKDFRKLKKEQQKELGSVMLMSEVAKSEHMKMGASERDPEAYISVWRESEGGDGADVYLLSREYGRDESILKFKIKPRKSAEELQGIVRLRYVYPEWRVYSAELTTGWELKGSFDQKGLIRTFLDAVIDENESKARSALYQCRSALGQYVGEYPELGFPNTLEQLGPAPEGMETGRDHLGLLDEELASGHEYHGYKFAYLRRGDDSYALTARPRKYGASGKKSFYMDESGTIRSTTKDEAATADSKEEE